jgi:hypothetical protein
VEKLDCSYYGTVDASQYIPPLLPSGLLPTDANELTNQKLSEMTQAFCSLIKRSDCLLEDAKLAPKYGRDATLKAVVKMALNGDISTAEPYYWQGGTTYAVSFAKVWPKSWPVPLSCLDWFVEVPQLPEAVGDTLDELLNRLEQPEPVEPSDPSASPKEKQPPSKTEPPQTKQPRKKSAVPPEKTKQEIALGFLLLWHQYGNDSFNNDPIPTKAAIGLQRISYNGLTVDLARVSELAAAVDADIWQAVETLKTIDANIWHRFKKTGQLKTGKENGLPQMNQTTLQQHLLRIAAEHQLTIPQTDTGKPSLSVNQCWTQYRHLDPIVDAYCRYTEQTKLRTFFTGLQQPRIHPRYRTMVRSGRTSCSGPNIQQLPSGSPVREAITARPGSLLFIIDYNSLELRTLATVCQQQVGFSKLRDVLVAGIDPHSYAAAMFAGCSLDDFNQLPDRKQLRQRAKVFNFGLPAGFGPTALVDHAKFAYGVELTLADAEKFVHQLTQEVYPELGLYLTEDTLGILAAKLQTDRVRLQMLWPQDWQLSMLRKVLAGTPHKADGSPYQPQAVERIWQQLLNVCGNAGLLPHIQNRNTAADSPLRKLLFSSVATTTGRLRGGVRFTAAKNAPFQGLAADGCKQALWQLTQAGYRVVAFIHDEFIIELNRLDDIDAAAQDIPRICSEAMQPFVPGIPVPTEFALTERWHKGAEAVFNDAGQLQVWYPKPQHRLGPYIRKPASPPAADAVFTLVNCE